MPRIAKRESSDKSSRSGSSQKSQRNRSKASKSSRSSNKENDDPKKLIEDKKKSGADEQKESNNKDAHILDTYKPENPSKINIRNLPPTLTEENFLKRLQTKNLPEYNYFNFCQSDESLHPWGTSQAYINFIDPNACEEFWRNWHGFDFSIDVPKEIIEEDISEEDAEKHIIGATNDQNEFVHVQGLHLLKLSDKQVHMTPDSYHCHVEISKFQKIPTKTSTYKVGENSLDPEVIKKELQMSGKIFNSAEFKHFCNKFEPKEEPEVASESAEGEHKEAPAVNTRTLHQQKMDAMMQKLDAKKKEMEKHTTRKSTLVLEMEREHEEERRKRRGNMSRMKTLEEKRKEKLEEDNRKYEEFKKMRGVDNKDRGDKSKSNSRRDRDRDRERDRDRDRDRDSNKDRDRDRDLDRKQDGLREENSNNSNKRNRAPKIRKRKEKEGKQDKEEISNDINPVDTKHKVAPVVQNKKSASKAEDIMKLMGSDIVRDGKTKRAEPTEGEDANDENDKKDEKKENKRKQRNRERKEKYRAAKQEGRPLDRSERIDRAKRLEEQSISQKNKAGTDEGLNKNGEDANSNQADDDDRKPSRNKRNRDRNRNKDRKSNGDNEKKSDRKENRDGKYTDDHDRR